MELKDYKNLILSLKPDAARQVLGGLHEDFEYFQNALWQLGEQGEEEQEHAAEIAKYLLTLKEKIKIVSGVLKDKETTKRVDANPSHIDVVVPRATVDNGTIEKSNFHISYDLLLNTALDPKELLDFYCIAYNETCSLVASRGERVRPSNIATAVRNATNLNYPTDFDIINFNFNVEDLVQKEEEKNV